jgi:hypothetical protein
MKSNTLNILISEINKLINSTPVEKKIIYLVNLPLALKVGNEFESVFKMIFSTYITAMIDDKIINTLWLYPRVEIERHSIKILLDFCLKYDTAIKGFL